MSEIHVANIRGQYRCYRTTDGIRREYFGPRFGGPRLAGQYADLAAGRPISPLRTPRRQSDFPPSPAASESLEVPTRGTLGF